jgi:hypothetical protein
LTLSTEQAKWTGGNKGANIIERRILRVWVKDALVHAKSAAGEAVQDRRVLQQEEQGGAADDVPW